MDANILRIDGEFGYYSIFYAVFTGNFSKNERIQDGDCGDLLQHC